MPLEMDHLSDDTLELYSLGTLPDPELVPVEEHLLICSSCQDRLRETDEYVQAMREAAAEYRRRHPYRSSKHASAGFRLWGYPRLKPVLIAGAACLLSLAMWRAQVQKRTAGVESAPVAVTLQAFRSTENAAAPAGTALRLIGDLEGLPPLSLWQLEVVAADGRLVGSFQGTARDGRLELLIPHGLSPGQYWVRAADPGSPGRILREFGLVAR